MKKIFSFLVLVSFSQAQAALMITNFNINTTTVSFDISGSIDSGVAIGTGGQFILYIGVPNDSDWITSNSFSPTVANQGGGSVVIVNGSGLSNDNATRGDNLQIQKEGAPSPASFWAVGDSVDASVTFAGTYVPANLDVSELIISAGNDGQINSGLPNPTFQVGAINLVPEPSTTLTLLLGALVFATRRHR